MIIHESPVTLIENDTVLLLRRLQQKLEEEGRHVQAEMMGRIADRLASTEEITPALEQLYAVQGWDSIALRLMWYVEQTQPNAQGSPNESLIEYEVEELYRLLTVARDEKADTPPPGIPPEEPGAIMGSVFEALHQFSSTLEELRRTEFEGEPVQGLRKGLFDSALSYGGRLHQVATAAGNVPLARFAAAFSLFFRYAIERDLFDDARVAHLIDNACQALQGILDHTGTEEYDALLLTTDMLQNPETLLE